MAEKYGSFNDGWDVWAWIQSIGYGIANIWGQGETANDIINSFKGKWQSSKGTATAKMSELIKFITQKYSGNYVYLQKILNFIDSKLSMLPPVLSQNLKKVVNSSKSKLLKDRKRVASDLNKVETAMNSSMSVASTQDMVPTAAKLNNQNIILDWANKAPDPKHDDFYKDYERTMK